MRVLAALSGGVDSAVAAAKAVEAGHDVVGVHMALSSQPQECRIGSRGCCSIEDAGDAARAAEIIGIPFYVWDLAQEFEQTVITDFVAQYKAGRTPNPCVRCNEFVKFRELATRARALGFDAVCTGHYAAIVDGEAGPELHRGADNLKDQSYVLAVMGPEELHRVVLPLGDAPNKAWVRSEAERLGLGVSNKPDSYDICFIPDGDYGSFIRQYTGKSYPSGPFLDEGGAVLGAHTGIIDYTLGQRRGLGVSSTRGRLCVKEVRPQDNSVVLSCNDSLYGSTLTAANLNLIACDHLSAPVRLRAKVRSRMAEQPGTVEQTRPDTIHLAFDQPQRAITPGQAVVLYDGDTVVGGATITP